MNFDWVSLSSPNNIENISFSGSHYLQILGHFSPQRPMQLCPHFISLPQASLQRGLSQGCEQRRVQAECSHLFSQGSTQSLQADLQGIEHLEWGHLVKQFLLVQGGQSLLQNSWHWCPQTKNFWHCFIQSLCSWFNEHSPHFPGHWCPHSRIFEHFSKHLSCFPLLIHLPQFP